MKILFFIPSLANSAGMERISTDLANLLSTAGNECMFAVLEGGGPFYPLDESVRIYNLDCRGRIRSARFMAARRLRKLLKATKPDILLNVDVSMIQVSALALPAQLGIRMITWEQFSLASTTSFFARLQRYFASLCSSKLIVLTHADREAYPFVLRPKIAVIHNFTRLNEQGIHTDLNQKTVLSVGRLCPTKGFDLLLEAWETVHRQCPDWKLRIVGGGEDKEALRRRIILADMESSVSLVPPTPKIGKEYLGASVYVLSSRNEPFGLVIAEAKSFGLPVVSFDCPYGPREIIRDKIDGMLVKSGNVPGLAKALIELLQDADLREKYGNAASQDYMQRWSSKNAICIWKQILG